MDCRRVADSHQHDKLIVAAAYRRHRSNECARLISPTRRLQFDRGQSCFFVSLQFKSVQANRILSFADCSLQILLLLVARLQLRACVKAKKMLRAFAFVNARQKRCRLHVRAPYVSRVRRQRPSTQITLLARACACKMMQRRARHRIFFVFPLSAVLIA